MKKYIDTRRYISTICKKEKKGTKPTKKNMASGLQVRACPSLQTKVEQVQKSGFAIGIISTNTFCGRISDIGE